MFEYVIKIRMCLCCSLNQDSREKSVIVNQRKVISKKTADHINYTRRDLETVFRLYLPNIPLFVYSS